MEGISFLDFRRAFSRRWAVGFWPRFFEFVFQPIFVATIVGLAFLAKEKESTIPAFANAFFYFTGLYAFWVGIFGSCQSLNGEVQNGEWSYWTLGLRRFIPHHVLSVFSVNLVCALLNVAVFIASIIVVAGILAGSREFNPFVSCFLTQDDCSADAFWQSGFMLKPMLVARFGTFGPLLFATSLYSLSLFVAAICGVCFGMAISVLFQDPAISLNASVAFVVLLGMVSLLGLQGDAGRSGKKPPSLRREFANQFESSFFNEFGSSNKATRVLVCFSRVLPQRYFFNIVRMPLEKDNDKSMIGAIRGKLDNMPQPSDDAEGAWWNCMLPLRSVHVDGGANSALKPWGIVASTNETDDATTYLAKEIKADKCFESRNRIPVFWKTLRKAILLELFPLALMSLFCLIVVNVGVLFFPAFRRLR